MLIFSGAGRRKGLYLAIGLIAAGWTRGAGADPAPKAAITADGPALLHMWAPAAFPPELLKKKIETSVTVRAIVDATGKVTEVRVLESGDARFNDAALAAVKSWGFGPAFAYGEPAACCLDIPVEFSSAKARKKKPSSLLPSPRFMPQPAPRTDAPEPLNSPAGDYPAVLTERKLPGIVVFACVVTAEGRVLHPRIKAASHVDFVVPALEALKQWTFTPVMEGDLAVASDLEAKMTFDLIGSVPTRVDLLAANGLMAPDGSAPEYAPALVTMADPVWPLDALLAGEGGSATVQFTVSSQGRVTNAKVLEATQPAFGQALVAAAESWQFEPAIKDGMAIDVALVKKIAFTAVPKEVPQDADTLTKLVAELRADPNIGSTRGLDARLEPVYRVAPVYPWSLRNNGHPAGEAVIELVIDRVGRARLPKVISATKEEFGWAAATAAAQWVFKPATRGGQPAEVKVRVPFAFTAPLE